MLSGTRYFQISLATPLVIPLLFVAFSAATGNVSALSAVLLASLVLAGGPYLLFATIVLIWSRNRQAATLRRASYFAPLIFLTFCFTLSPLLLLTGSGVKEVLSVLLLFSAYTLAIGYFYVLIINAIYELFLSHHSEA